MSRLVGIARSALGAALTSLLAVGSVSSGCAGRGGGPAPPVEATARQADLADDPAVLCGVTQVPGREGVVYGTYGIGPQGHNPYKNVYWGNLHQHTGYSLDAYSWGTRATPAQAYAFADGSGRGTETQYPQTRPGACSA